MSEKPPVKILFVCLGNICRSPLAEGIMRAVVGEAGRDSDFVIDSAGTGGWHVGSAPDPRSIAVAARNGIDIAAQRCRRIEPADFESFDLILAMDRSNLDDLLALAPAPARPKVHMFLAYASGQDKEIGDPYYGGADGFDRAYRIIRDASLSLIDRFT